jgi:Beta-propeller repeat
MKKTVSILPPLGFLLLLLTLLSAHSRLYAWLPGDIQPKAAHTPGSVGEMNFRQTAPLLFIENKGQVKDQFGKRRQDIQFMMKLGNGLSVFLGEGALHYQFSNCNNNTCESNEAPPAMYRMDIELVGANRHAQMLATEQQEYHENYFLTGFDAGDATAHSFKKITYKNVYPKIDWVLYVNGSQLKHEFLVHKGGRVSDIKMKYGGATSLQIDGDGTLLAETPLGNITEQAPISYQQNGWKIASRFHHSGNMLSYNVSRYEGELTIDPVLAWATYFGGTGDENFVYTATDILNNVYIAGRTKSISGVATVGAYDEVFGGGISYGDAFVAKFGSSGALLWATYYGGAGEEYLSGIATDVYGNVYITGSTLSLTNIATPGAHQTTYGGNSDGFLAKFNSSGMIQWATYYGGNLNDGGNSVVTDVAGNVYMAGSASSTSGIATAGTHQSAIGGGFDAFLAKFNSAGVRQWATYYGGTHADQAFSVDVTNSGSIYLGGSTSSNSGIATPGAHQTTPGFTFLVKFDAAGNRQWGTYYCGSGGGETVSVKTDNAGSVYLQALQIPLQALPLQERIRPVLREFMMRF